MDISVLDKQGTTIGESVYQNLRSGIIELNIKPGQMVSIKDLCDQLCVSRSPVRDALIKLEKEGLITSMPQKGTMISKIDIARVSEEHFLRFCLEEKVLQLFIDSYTESDRKRLYELVEQQKESSRKGNIRAFLQQDDNFHKIFFDVAQKQLCWQTIVNSSGHYRRIRLLSAMDQNILNNVILQHEQMLKFIEKKDHGKLMETLKLHLTKIEEEEEELQRKYPELFVGVEKVNREENSFLSMDFLNQLH